MELYRVLSINIFVILMALSALVMTGFDVDQISTANVSEKHSDKKTYIPSQSDQAVVIHIAFHVFQRGDSERVDVATLRNWVNSVNRKFRAVSILTQHGVVNSKIQISLGKEGKDRIHFYPNHSHDVGLCDGSSMLKHIKEKNKWEVNELPVFLLLDSLFDGSANSLKPSFDNRKLEQYICMSSNGNKAVTAEKRCDVLFRELLNVLGSSGAGDGSEVTLLEIESMHRALVLSSVGKYAIRRLTTHDYERAPEKFKLQNTHGDLYRAWSIPTVRGEWGLHRIFWGRYHWNIEFVPLPEEIFVDSLTSAHDENYLFAVTKSHKLIFAIRDSQGYATKLGYVPEAVDVDYKSMVIAPNSGGLFYLTTDGTLMHCKCSRGEWKLRQWPTLGERVLSGSLVRGASAGVFGLVANKDHISQNTLFYAGSPVSSSNFVFSLVSGKGEYKVGTLASLKGGGDAHDDVIVQASVPLLGERWFRFFWDKGSWIKQDLAMDVEGSIENCVNPIRKNSVVVHPKGSFALALTKQGQIVYLGPSSKRRGNWVSYYPSFSCHVRKIVGSQTYGWFGTTFDGQLFSMDFSSEDFSLKPQLNFVSVQRGDVEPDSLIKSLFDKKAAGSNDLGESFLIWSDGNVLKYAKLEEEIKFVKK